MTIKEAKKLKDHDYVSNDTRQFHLRIHHNNPHDLWFWHCRKNSKELMQRPHGGGYCTRVIFYSKNVLTTNLKFLKTLTKNQNQN